MRTTAALLGLLVAGWVWAGPAPQECPVHRTVLQPAKLRIVYGLPSPEEFKEAEAARKRFPFGRDYVLGGCIVRPDKTVDGFLCAGCVKARAAWLRKHRR
jgi:hypothetical protein